MVSGWRLEKIKNLMHIETGSRNTEHKDDSGRYLFFVRSHKIEYIDTYHYDCEAVLTAGDGVGTGKVFHYVNGKFDAHQRVYVMSKFDGIDGKYFYYNFSTSFINEVIKQTAKSSVDSIRRNMIADMEILLPPISEQHAIVEILSNMDGYIAAQEKLIAKKKAIKQGAMQELFTGKWRLPGFDGEWIERKLSEILDVGHGQNQKGIEKPDGKYPILGTGGEMGHTNCYLYDRPSVLVGRKGTIDNPQYIDKPFWTIDTLFYTIIHDNFLAKYLYYLFCMIDWNKYNEASGVPSLSSKTIGEIEVRIPLLPEQTAITTVLSDMDTEIEALTVKLNKATSIKRGMMQELLTGRIRLIKPEATTGPVIKGGYRESVILVALVNAFSTEQYPFTAFDRQKFPYLFHRHIEGVAKGYKKFAAGPYNPDLKYKAARPIALKKRYIRECVGLYKGDVVAENAGEALNYFAQWYGDEPLKWMEQFRYIKNRKEELELLTTVDKAIMELRFAGSPVTMLMVKEVIKKTPAWKDKLTRPLFSDANITRAIEWGIALFGQGE
ncbi:MAG: restriction endonuclease subunit S [Treponema sp.]|jgi:type I restriction enzyme S subunit|nr:restriction endonuclease subunit S [Treponema sp.]